MNSTVERLGNVRLLKGEEVFRAVHPHFFGLYELYIVWLYLIAISMVFATRGDALRAWVSEIPTGIAAETLLLLVWAGVVLLPALAIAIFRISLRWFVGLAAAVGIGLFLRYATSFGNPESSFFISDIENWTIFFVGCLGVAGTEWYRLCHLYVVTNKRIVVASTGMWHSERSLAYGKITDLILDSGILGRLFGFGTIIPLTASGLGTGADMAGGGAGFGASLLGLSVGMGVAGGHSRRVPKESMAYTLFNVPDPEALHGYVMERMTQ